MRLPSPYLLYPEVYTDQDGYPVYVLEEHGLSLDELEQRGRMMRAAPLLFRGLKRMVELAEQTWDKPEGSHTQRALKRARQALDAAINGTKEDCQYAKIADDEACTLKPPETNQ